MEPENKPKTVDERYQILLVLWCALLFTQFVFLSMLFFMKNELFRFEFTEPPGGKNPLLILILAAVSLTSFSLSFLLKFRMLRQAESEQDPNLVQTALILSCALCESISLFGFISGLALGYPYFFLWFALGIGGILLHFPKKAALLRATYKHEL